MRIGLNGDTFVVGETVDLDLTLVNAGAVPVQIPDIGVPGIGYPVYTLTGPDYPGGIRFIKIPLDEHERPPSARPPSPRAPPPRLREIAPGQVLETGVAVSRTITIDQPGSYTIAARLAYGGVDLAAGPLAFRLLANTFLDAGLALDSPARGSGCRVVWLGEGEGAHRVGEAWLVENRPDLGEIERPTLRRVRELPPDASNAFAPWSNYDRADALFHWDGWREGSRLVALQAGAASPRHADLGSTAAWMVAPALMPRSGRMLAFAVDPHGGRLATVVFLPDSETPPSVSWRPLPLPAVAGAAALPPAGEAAEVLLIGPVPATQPPSGPIRHDLSLAVLTGDPNAAPRRTVVAGVVAMSGSVPAFHIGPDGTGRASLIALANGGQQTMVLVDVVFPPNLDPPLTTVTPLPPVSRPAVAAAVAFRSGGDGAGRDWALLFAGDEIVSSRSDFRPMRLPLHPAVPLQLVSRPSLTYVLAVDPVSGPTLLPLR